MEYEGDGEVLMRWLTLAKIAVSEMKKGQADRVGVAQESRPKKDRLIKEVRAGAEVSVPEEDKEM